MKRILVIGATGNVGREVVTRLLVQDRAVRALARDPEHARLPVEVEVARGDLTAPETLEALLENVDVGFLVWTAPPATIGPVLKKMFKNVTAGRVALVAAQDGASTFSTAESVAGDAREDRGDDREIGLEWTFPRPGIFAANARAWWAPQIRAGDLVRWPYLDMPTAPIHERGIAAVGVRALTEEGHNRAEYVLTGLDGARGDGSSATKLPPRVNQGSRPGVQRPGGHVSMQIEPSGPSDKGKTGEYSNRDHSCHSVHRVLRRSWSGEQN